MKVTFTQEEVAAITQPLRVVGTGTAVLRGIATLASAEPGDITFLGNKKYKEGVAATRASLVLLPPDYDGAPAAGQVFFLVDNPSVALARLCSRLEQALWPKPLPGVHPTAIVAPEVHVPETATVGPFCIIEAEATIGERAHLEARVFVGRGAAIGPDCWLSPNVSVLAECVLGARVRLHPGVVIGADGFGYELVQGRHQKVPQVGGVRLGDDVEIGANSTVDRSRFEQTLVGEGTKIDNLVQIGHNVVIGKHCMLCAQVGVAGSCTLGDYVVLGGQVGLAGHLTIGSGAMVAAQSGVKDDIPARSTVFGSPAQGRVLEARLLVLRNRLPELFKRVEALEAAARPGAPGALSNL